MSFGHERLDVYRAALEYVGWAYRFCEGLKGHRNAKEQLLRASQAIPLNIAEGNGKARDGDRRRYFEIARGSALECSAIQDVLEVCGGLSTEENARTKAVLDRIVAMLTRLGRRGYAIREEPAEYGAAGIDSDTNSDSDSVEGTEADDSESGSASVSESKQLPNNMLHQVGAKDLIGRPRQESMPIPTPSSGGQANESRSGSASVSESKQLPSIWTMSS